MVGHPLEGIRVVDFTWAWAGAHATDLLAMLGAEVIKVESLSRLDHSRLFAITTGESFEGPDQSPVFNDMNLNKLSININLAHPKGIELAKSLVQISDVVAQNMRPGVIERLGLGYEVLRKLKPDIIMLSSSAMGSTGPESQYTGYAPSFAAASGLSYVTGYPGEEPTLLRGEIDLLSANTSAFAIMAALIHKQTTGEGQHIDLSSSEASSVMIGEVLMDYTLNGRVQSRKGNLDEIMAPHNCYRCKGEDKWVSIAIATDQEWRAFCQASRHPDWVNDKRFADALSRWENQVQLDGLVTSWTANYTHHEVTEMLQKVGVAAFPSMNSEELYEDPHLNERGYWVEVNHPLMGKKVAAGPPWKLSKTPASIQRHGPLLGEHNSYVFEGLLGLAASEIECLRNEKAIY